MNNSFSKSLIINISVDSFDKSVGIEFMKLRNQTLYTVSLIIHLRIIYLK